ncbi:hypothetical protein I4U23_005078 [Adineta vaga]|nr:hypothetical protein I4U23_005078 [Adineta vaga]
MIDDDIQISVEETNRTSDFEQSVETMDERFEHLPVLLQNGIEKEVQRRTFSNWIYSSPIFIDQLIEAGFYSCNLSDRVICLDCNLQCQYWTPYIDHPFEIHRRKSHHCRYIQSVLKRSRTISLSSVPMINANFSSTVNVVISQTNFASNSTEFQFEEIVFKSYNHPEYAEVPKRTESFAGWSYTNSPTIDDLVRAGFFYNGTGDMVTCFYCNGSILYWGCNDNPAIEHARLLPRCAYARQLCGANLYGKIQEAERHRQGWQVGNICQYRNVESRSDTTNLTINRLLNVLDRSLLNKLVDTRLKLSISQELMNTSFNEEIVRRVWEDQLQIKEEDFPSELDLITACTIRQRQIDRISPNSQNFVNLRDVKIEPIQLNRSMGTVSHSSLMMLSSSTSTVTTSAEGGTEPSSIETILPTTVLNEAEDVSRNTEVHFDPCSVCLTEERQLVCIPCGHLIACVPCGHSCKTCPLCRREIEAFIRIYL